MTDSSKGWLAPVFDLDYLPKNCGRRPLVSRKTPEGEGRVLKLKTP
jgi:hypothetical protein